MSEAKQVAIKDVSLDLGNYRTVPQSTEVSAMVAMVSTSPDRFWALTESLLQDGYLPTETIILLRTGRDESILTVKEGNRRIAALKLIHGLLSPAALELPDTIAGKIKSLSEEWRTANASVPCAIYDAKDAATVDRIVTLAHGKGEKAGRDQWNAVARARHNRQVSKAPEPALDLLEKYLQDGRNVTPQQRARWAGDFPLSVLAEAVKRLAPRVGTTSSPDLARRYPAIRHRPALEAILHDIGQENLGFDKIRDRDVDFAVIYGMPAISTATARSAGRAAGSGPGSGSGKATAPGRPKAAPKLKALAISDPKAVRRLLRDFMPRGEKREKVVTLRDEAARLDVAKTPLAFCFVLRSMFEISAKVYCMEHSATGGPSTTKAEGKEKSLVEVLRGITAHLTKNKSNKEMVKALHGAMTELAKTEGLLSVTSMNQLGG